MKSLRFAVLALALPLVFAEPQEAEKNAAIPPAVQKAVEGYAKNAAVCDFLIRFTCAGINGQADYLEHHAAETDTSRFELALNVLQSVSAEGLPEELQSYLKSCEAIEIEAIKQMKAASTAEEKSRIKDDRTQQMDALAAKYPSIALLMDSESSYFIAIVGMNIKEEMAKVAQPIIAKLRRNEMTYAESRRLAAEGMRAITKRMEQDRSSGTE